MYSEAEGLNGAVVSVEFMQAPFGTRISSRSCICCDINSLIELGTKTRAGQAQYPEIGTPISLPQNCDSGGDQLAITPDGTTVFVLSTGGVFVQPVP
jgi:hypothetical protein